MEIVPWFSGRRIPKRRGYSEVVCGLQRARAAHITHTHTHTVLTSAAHQPLPRAPYRLCLSCTGLCSFVHFTRPCRSISFPCALPLTLRHYPPADGIYSTVCPSRHSFPAGVCFFSRPSGTPLSRLQSLLKTFYPVLSSSLVCNPLFLPHFTLFISTHTCILLLSHNFFPFSLCISLCVFFASMMSIYFLLLCVIITLLLSGYYKSSSLA